MNLCSLISAFTVSEQIFGGIKKTRMHILNLLSSLMFSRETTLQFSSLSPFSMGSTLTE